MKTVKTYCDCCGRNTDDLPEPECMTIQAARGKHSETFHLCPTCAGNFLFTFLVAAAARKGVKPKLPSHQPTRAEEDLLPWDEEDQKLATST